MTGKRENSGERVEGQGRGQSASSWRHGKSSLTKHAGWKRLAGQVGVLTPRRHSGKWRGINVAALPCWWRNGSRPRRTGWRKSSRARLSSATTRANRGVPSLTEQNGAPTGERATLQSIAHSGHRKNFPDVPRGGPARTPAASHSRCFRSMARLLHNPISAAGAEKVRVGLNLNASTRAKIGRLAPHRGYTITALVDELVERAERRVTTRLPSRALTACRIDRPRVPVHLRRAVSGTYYAVFHLALKAAAELVVGRLPSAPPPKFMLAHPQSNTVTRATV
jgi:hypothetical protein